MGGLACASANPCSICNSLMARPWTRAWLAEDTPRYRANVQAGGNLAFGTIPTANLWI